MKFQLIRIPVLVALTFVHVYGDPSPPWRLMSGNKRIADNQKQNTKEVEEDDMTSKTKPMEGQDISKPNMGVPGPRSLHDKILIVGGGPAGIHMAYLLKSKGFTDVTVFEKEDRIGGKSYTRYHRGTPHEMGTCYTIPSYDEIYKLVKKYDAGEPLPLTPGQVWLESSQQYTRMSCKDAVNTNVNVTNPDSVKQIIGQAVRNYITAHRSLFSSYKGTLMPRPSLSVLQQTNMTLLQFLKVNDAEVLLPIFICSVTMMGYGHLDEIPALYGLMWITPKVISAFVTPTPPGKKPQQIKILSKGFQFLWQEIARQESLDVKLNRNVIAIYRIGRSVYVRYEENSCKIFTRKFDFLVLSPDMSLLKNIMNLQREERKLFSGISHDYFSVSLVDHAFSPKRSDTPIDRFFFNILSKNESTVYLQRDSYSTINYIVGDNYTGEPFPDGKDGNMYPSSVVYQFSRDNPKYDDLIDINLRDHFRNILKIEDNFNVIENITWLYFPKYSANALTRGVLWDIVDLQGRYNTWYIGSSVSFESVNSVVDYNLMLMDMYSLPSN